MRKVCSNGCVAPDKIVYRRDRRWRLQQPSWNPQCKRLSVILVLGSSITLLSFTSDNLKVNLFSVILEICYLLVVMMVVGQDQQTNF